MPKSPNQKLKLLYLMEILLQQTDERHPMTVPEMISGLARHGVAAERKSIYNDLESLRTFGLDIVQTKSRTTGYYIGARSFEVPELKLLVDSVQSSKFITHKKTLALIKKIEGLASIYDAQLLQRQVYVRGRVKSMNESVYYNVDEIADAISRDRQIRFHYFEYTIDKQRHYRKDGAFYIVSPMALMWDNENYYLLAWDAEAQLRKHYRVDKMTDISALDAPREGMEDFSEQDLSAYTKKSVQHVHRRGAHGASALCQSFDRLGARPLRQGRDRGRRRDGAFHRLAQRGHEPEVLRVALRLRHGRGDPLAAVGAAGNAGDARQDRGYIHALRRTVT